MASADTLLALIHAHTSGDNNRFVSIVRATAANAKASGKLKLASQLDRAISHTPSGRQVLADPHVQNALWQIDPRRTLDSLALPALVKEGVAEFIEEYAARDRLAAHGLAPRHKILLAGPPGNGKTSLVEAIAHALEIPFFVIRYEGLVESHLGETASRLQKVFDFVQNKPCILFFDEFDTVGKERGDKYEVGEIKRIVSSLLLQADAIPPHVILAAATNHPEMLDRAVWRRFELRFNLPTPKEERLCQFLSAALGESPLLPDVAQLLTNYAEAEIYIQNVNRHAVLKSTTIPIAISRCLTQWRGRLNPVEG